MDGVLNLTCQSCNHVGEAVESGGFYYCSSCGEQNLDVVDTAADEGGEAGFDGSIYLASHRRASAPSAAINATPVSQYNPLSQSKVLRNLGLEDKISPFKVKEENMYTSQFDETSPSIPADFGGSAVASFEDYHNEIRLRYVLGLQMMVELQCEALVKEFKVTPLICGLVGPIWLRFVSKTGVFDDDWADKVILDSEMQKEGELEGHKSRHKYKAEPHNMFGQRAVLIWFRSLKKRIPLVCTVVVSYLACHIAREAIMPSDMIKWTREGKLPYFSAFVEIEKRIGHPSVACPISSSFMFRPQRAVSVHNLESSAASIAQLIGLELPPVNFYALAYRYLEKLSLPVEKILPYACRIYEWSMSPDLWLSLSKDYFRLPTHVCVVSVLVVAIRILYNINGYGEWEKSLSHDDSAKDNGVMNSTGLLKHLHAIYNEIADTHEYSKDLPTYLKYCNDVVFAGLEPSYGNHEEQNMIENLWNFYQKEKNTKPSDPGKQDNTSLNGTGLSDDNSSESFPDGANSDSKGNKGSRKSVLKEAIRQLKLDMEENRFCYIPPSVKPKKLDYVHYVRKQSEGALTYVAHADYYILLRACARVAQDDIRILHIGVLSLERRLAWLEKRINQCLHLKLPNTSCQFCSGKTMENENISDDVSKLANLNI